jgi:glyoxylase-like metal-dependent hydrolase (beta-lactamase superfamily II)
MKISDNIHVFDFNFSGPMRNHVYIVKDQKDAVLIDAHIGQETLKVISAIKKVTPLENLKSVILTHGHMDHTGACPYIEENTNASISAHIADAQYIEEPWTQFLTLYKDVGTTQQAYQDFITQAGGRGVTVTNPLHNRDTIKVGTIELKIIHTPGHSPGSICIYKPETKTLFTGDVLIPNHWYKMMLGVFQDASKHIQSMKLLSEMDIQMLCPGHEPVLLGSDIEKEFNIHFNRYYEIQSGIIEILSGSKNMTLWEIFYELSERIIGPGDYQPGIGTTATIRGFLNKLCYEGTIVQKNGSTWAIADI